MKYEELKSRIAEIAAAARPNDPYWSLGVETRFTTLTGGRETYWCWMPPNHMTTKEFDSPTALLDSLERAHPGTADHD